MHSKTQQTLYNAFHFLFAVFSLIVILSIMRMLAVLFFYWSCSVTWIYDSKIWYHIVYLRERERERDSHLRDVERSGFLPFHFYFVKLSNLLIPKMHVCSDTETFLVMGRTWCQDAHIPLCSLEPYYDYSSSSFSSSSLFLPFFPYFFPCLFLNILYVWQS